MASAREEDRLSHDHRRPWARRLGAVSFRPRARGSCERANLPVREQGVSPARAWELLEKVVGHFDPLRFARARVGAAPLVANLPQAVSFRPRARGSCPSAKFGVGSIRVSPARAWELRGGWRRVVMAGCFARARVGAAPSQKIPIWETSGFARARGSCSAFLVRGHFDHAPKFHRHVHRRPGAWHNWGGHNARSGGGWVLITKPLRMIWGILPNWEIFPKLSASTGTRKA